MQDLSSKYGNRRFRNTWNSLFPRNPTKGNKRKHKSVNKLCNWFQSSYTSIEYNCANVYLLVRNGAIGVAWTMFLGGTTSQRAKIENNLIFRSISLMNNSKFQSVGGTCPPLATPMIRQSTQVRVHNKNECWRVWWDEKNDSNQW